VRLPRALWAAAVVALVPPVCHATFIDGNDLLRLATSGKAFERQFAIGYVTGAYDLEELRDPSTSKCVGGNLTSVQLVDIVTQYLEKNPATRHYHGAGLAVSAIRDALCKK
jgi:hypothetical protein